MLEFFLGAFLGYSFGKTIGGLASNLRKPDKILKWDNQSLGYRPVSPQSKIEPSETYLICYEVKSNDQER